MSEELQLRTHGDPSCPTLIYLPGLHGDWTLVGSFRRALDNRVRFIELTYPRTTEWSLDDYAAGIETALEKNGITRGWLLGESFGSQVAWALLSREKFQTEGVVLAGGFVRHPAHWAIRGVERICGGISLSVVARLIFAYEMVARIRFRHSPEILANLDEFVARRTEPDRQAAKHRLRLVAQYDPRPIAQRTKVPVYAITGFVDPIVPWVLVRPWLRRHCPALRDYRISWRADHMVLGTAADVAADQVVRWIGQSQSAPRPA